MAVIHPSIFQVMKRFPEQRGEIAKCFHDSESFQSLCEDYKQCSQALQFWSRVDSAESMQRKAEYKELFRSLEFEILQYLLTNRLKYENE